MPIDADKKIHVVGIVHFDLPLSTLFTCPFMLVVACPFPEERSLGMLSLQRQRPKGRQVQCLGIGFCLVLMGFCLFNGWSIGIDRIHSL